MTSVFSSGCQMVIILVRSSRLLCIRRGHFVTSWLLVDDVVFVTLIDHVAAAAAVAAKWSGTFVLDRASTRSHLL